MEAHWKCKHFLIYLHLDRKFERIFFLDPLSILSEMGNVTKFLEKILLRILVPRTTNLELNWKVLTHPNEKKCVANYLVISSGIEIQIIYLKEKFIKKLSKEQKMAHKLCKKLCKSTKSTKDTLQIYNIIT